MNNMTDANFIKRPGLGISRPVASLASIPVGGAAKPAGMVRRRVDHARGVVRRWPMAARMLGIVGIGMLGWFLLMAPLFIAR